MIANYKVPEKGAVLGSPIDEGGTSESGWKVVAGPELPSVLSDNLIFQLSVTHST
jgi:hypothetical protein